MQIKEYEKLDGLALAGLLEEMGINRVTVVAMRNDQVVERSAFAETVLAQGDLLELVAFVRGRLAAFKAPKRIVVMGTLGRGPNGKLDYPALSGMARLAT